MRAAYPSDQPQYFVLRATPHRSTSVLRTHSLPHALSEAMRQDRLYRKPGTLVSVLDQDDRLVLRYPAPSY